MFAERAAWEFVKKDCDFPELNKKFELVVIVPSTIVGPVLINSWFQSGEMVVKVLKEYVWLCPKIYIACVDVRNVAEAHVNAVLKDEVNGKRFILVGEHLWFRDICCAMKEKYGDNYFIGTYELFWWLAWLVSFFVTEMVYVLSVWGKMLIYDNSASRNTLGIEYIPIKQSLWDMGDTLIDAGYVPDKRKKKKSN